MLNRKWWIAGSVSVVAAVALAAGVVKVSASDPPTPPGAPAVPQQTASCDTKDPQSGTALSPESIAGQWTDVTTGEIVTVVQKNPADATHFTLKGRHDWEGNLSGGTLTFTRTPTADEMEHTAPEWARKAVEGQVKWSLELNPKDKCGVPELSGKWYPGLIKIEQQQGADGSITSQHASVAGKGNPVDKRYTKEAPAIYGVVVLKTRQGSAPRAFPIMAIRSPILPRPLRNRCRLTPSRSSMAYRESRMMPSASRAISARFSYTAQACLAIGPARSTSWRRSVAPGSNTHHSPSRATRIFRRAPSRSSNSTLDARRR